MHSRPCQNQTLIARTIVATYGNIHDTPVMNTRQIMTEFIIEILNERLDKIDNFLQGGMKLDSRNRFGMTPLMYTIIHIRRKSFAFLIERGADINAQDDQGDTPLIYAIRAMRGFVDPLLAKNPNLTLKNKNGQTARDFAIRLGLCVTTRAIDLAMARTALDPLVKAACASTTIEHDDPSAKRQCLKSASSADSQ